MIIPLGDALLRRSSNLPAGFVCLLRGPFSLAHRADTPLPHEGSGGVPAYLVLLRVGFTLPRLLPAARCALTAPFHPYLLLAACVAWGRRYVLCCTGRTDGLNHPPRTLSGTLPCGVRTFLSRSTACATRGSDHPAACRFKCNAGDGPGGEICLR
jgi:hypothetical protein